MQKTLFCLVQCCKFYHHLISFVICDLVHDLFEISVSFNIVSVENAFSYHLNGSSTL